MEAAFPYPIIADPRRTIAHKLSMVDHTIPHDSQPLTCRAAFIISPDRRLRAQILYPASTGRNFDEILRAVDGLQRSAAHQGIVTPVNWRPGMACIISPSVPDDEAEERFGDVRVQDLPSSRRYLRWTNDPAHAALDLAINL